MTPNARRHIALASVFPTLLTVPAILLLATTGAAAWGVALSLGIALAVHAAITYTRLGNPDAVPRRGR